MLGIALDFAWDDDLDATETGIPKEATGPACFRQGRRRTAIRRSPSTPRHIWRGSSLHSVEINRIAYQASLLVLGSENGWAI